MVKKRRSPRFQLSNYEDPIWVCTLCNRAMIEIGFIMGRCLVYNQTTQPYLERFGLSKKGWTDLNDVSYADGAYAILGGQGHRDDESGWFHRKPRKLGDMFNPDDYYSDWMSVAEAHQHVCYIQERFHYFVGEDGLYERVLVELAATLIERFEAKHGNIERLFRRRAPKIFKLLAASEELRRNE